MTATETAAKTPRKKAAAAPKDTIALLKADCKAMSALFAENEKTRSVPRKALVARTCASLDVHTQIEEEIFYPAVKGARKDTLRVTEAPVEHATVDDLNARLAGVDPGGERFAAKVMVLSESVKQRVKEEQNGLNRRGST